MFIKEYDTFQSTNSDSISPGETGAGRALAGGQSGLPGRYRGSQLRELKGFLQQIVEERTKAVRRQGLAGHEHQWNAGACRIAAQVPGDLPAIAVGQMQVEKDKIRLASDRAFQPGSAVRRGLDVVVPFAEDIRRRRPCSLWAKWCACHRRSESVV